MARSQAQRGSRFSISAVIWFIAAAVLAAFSGAFSATQVWREKAPALALAIDPMEPKALVKSASQLLAKPPGDKLARQIRASAMQALRREPLMPDALRVLAMASTGAKDAAQRGRLARQSYALSRRDVGNQLLMVAECEKRQDLACVLRHFDQAMTVSPASREGILPAMVAVVPAPDFQQAMAPYVKQDRPWLASFYVDAIMAGQSLPALSQMTRRAGGLASDAKYRAIERDLVTALIDKEHWAEARQFYLSLKGADPKLLTSPAFTRASLSDDAGKLGWSFPEPAGAGAETPDPANVADGIAIYAEGGKRDVVARKYLYLPAGPHRIAARFGAVDMAQGDGVALAVYCRGDGAGATLVGPSDVKPDSNKAMRWSFSVPAGCPVQLIEISAMAETGGTGMEAAITSLAVD